jgi:short-subunit dehydrogenase
VQLAGRTVLLTGATGGLGHAIAAAFAARGARLVLSGRRPEVLASLASSLPDASVVAADLNDAGSIHALVEANPDVDVVVANAGMPGSGALDSFTEAEIDRVLDVNLRAPVLLARLYVPRMRARGSGHLVFMSSLSGRAPVAGGALYAATKFGLRGFGASLRADLRATGVGVSIVSPGFVHEAGMFADSGAELPAGFRTVSPEQVADATVDAVERDRGEVTVAPIELRLGTALAAVAPDLASKVAGKLGGERIAERMAEGQADKRS